MAYFNHAFTKLFLGTQISGSGAGENPNSNLNNGFLTTAGKHTSVLADVNTGISSNNYGPGSYGFFNPKTWLSVTTAEVTGCCPLVLASASLLSNDKIGPFHGGYKESNKSKMINPKYVQKAYRVDSCVPQQSVISVGNTPSTSAVGIIGGVGNVQLPLTPKIYVDGTYYNVTLIGGSGVDAKVTVIVVGGEIDTVPIVTDGGFDYLISDTGLAIGPEVLVASGTGATTVDVAALNAVLDPAKFQGGTVQANCCFEFLCGETYYLRIDMKGSPVLRFLNHNSYQTVYAYTGCCSGPTPTAVDSTLVMIDWAKMIITNEYLKNFAAPVVYDEIGKAWYAPGTTVTFDGTNSPVTSTDWWDAYVSPGHTPGACAGIRLFGAYVETKFGNSSFQITDFFEKEPVRLYASMVDYNGDPCVFEAICVYNDCLGVQGMGFGEQVVRDLILSESYLQNYFATDIRIREITQGDQILNSVSRNALYTRYFLLHSVPRFQNPSGTFDNDRYMLEIISTGINTDLETFLTTWLGECANCVPFETESCTHCEIVPDPSLR